MRARLIVPIVVAAVTLTGCERAMHDMYDQRRYKPAAPTSLFPDGTIERAHPDDTVAAASGGEAFTSSGRRGDAPIVVDPEPAMSLGDDGRPRAGVPDANAALTNPYRIDAALLARGRQRFGIYCVPCHGVLGDGDGYVARRGFPHPPSYDEARLRNAPDGHFYAVITHGYGLMLPFADRIAPPDRWAIVAYIRALQLAQHATVGDVAPADRAALEAP